MKLRPCVKRCRLLRRHAVIHWWAMCCFTALNCADYSAVTLKSLVRKGLRGSDYSDVTHNLLYHKELPQNADVTQHEWCARACFRSLREPLC